MGPLQDDWMVGILVDTCGWTSLVDSGLNLDVAFESAVGEFELLVINEVRMELESLEAQRRGLLLDLLDIRSKQVASKELGHTDDALVSLSKDNSWPVLTVDKGLKQKLIGRGCSYVEVTSGPSLRLVEP